MKLLTILFPVTFILGVTIGCGRFGSHDPIRLAVDLNKVAGVNVCPDRTPDLPHGNVDLTILLPRELRQTRTSWWSRVDPLRSVGQTGMVTTKSGKATLRVKLNLAERDPGIFTLAISTRPNVSYCDVRVR
jgi:hypothetical protein